MAATSATGTDERGGLFAASNGVCVEKIAGRRAYTVWSNCEHVFSPADYMAYETEHGWQCECQGFLYRAKCRHITAVLEAEAALVPHPERLTVAPTVVMHVPTPVTTEQARTSLVVSPEDKAVGRSQNGLQGAQGTQKAGRSEQVLPTSRMTDEEKIATLLSFYEQQRA